MEMTVRGWHLVIRLLINIYVGDFLVSWGRSGIVRKGEMTGVNNVMVKRIQHGFERASNEHSIF